MDTYCSLLLKRHHLTLKELIKSFQKNEKDSLSFVDYIIDSDIVSDFILTQILEHQLSHKTLFTESFKAIVGDEFAKDVMQIYYAQFESLDMRIAKTAQEFQQEDVKNSITLEVQQQKIEETHLMNEQISMMWTFPEINKENIELSLFDEFVESFDENIKISIENHVINLAKAGDADLTNIMSTIYRDFHTIKGTARFCKLFVIEKLTHELEELISEVQHFYNELPSTSKNLVVDALLNGLDLMWNLRNLVCEHKTEKLILNNAEWIQKAQLMLISIHAAKASVQKLSEAQTAEDILNKF